MKTRFNHMAAISALSAVTVILVVSAMLMSELEIAGTVGFPLDDSWIHATIAKSTVESGVWSFNPGEVTGGSTAPLWTAMLMPGIVLGNVVAWAILLGALFHIATATGLAFIARHLWPDEPWTWWLAALVTVLSPSLAWATVSGMEIMLALTMSVFGAWFVLKRRPEIGLGILSASIWIRPESVLFLAVMIAYVIVDKQDWLRSLVPVVTPMMLYVCFNMIVASAFVPDTVSSKAGYSFGLWCWLKEAANLYGLPFRGYSLSHPITLLAGLIIGLAVSWRTKMWPFVIWLIAFIVICSFGTPHASTHARYLMPTLPWVFLLFVAGVRTVGHRVGAKLIIIVTVVWTLILLNDRVIVTGHNVRNITEMQVAIGKRIAEQTPPNAVIAASDVGAIGFFGNRRVVDLCGLVTTPRTIQQNITQEKPDVVVMFPDWFFDNEIPQWFSDKYDFAGFVTTWPNTVCSRASIAIFTRK